MTTTAMPPKADRAPQTTPAAKPTPEEKKRAVKTALNDLDKKIDTIIERDRIERPQHKSPRKGAMICSFSGAALFFLAFPPFEWAALGWIALVPWLVMTLPKERPRWMYRSLFLWGMVSQLALLQWMRLGDATMYFAWLALSFSCACYVPLFVAFCRKAVHQHRLPLLVVAPVVWVGFEFLQAYMWTGFPWYFLGHTQYAWTEIIQVSDLVGAYGVSVLCVLSAVAIALLIPQSWLKRVGLLPPSAVEEPPRVSRRLIAVAVSVACFCLALGYGFYRRAEFAAIPESEKRGPRVALLQGNFTATAQGKEVSDTEVVRTYERLTGGAVAFQPDLIVWPEGVYPTSLFESKGLTETDLEELKVPDHYRKNVAGNRLANYAGMANAAMIIGVDATRLSKGGRRDFTSAAFVVPGQKDVVARYDKMHLIAFGEYIPLQGLIPGLHKFTPYSAGYGLSHGDGPVIFKYKDWKFAPAICYEDTIPRVARRIYRAGGDDGIDVLVNITNDGWFHPKTDFDKQFGSEEAEQHLITAAFRCVELRTPMVRAVNTGVSAVVDSEGIIREPKHLLRFTKQPNGRLTRETISMRDESGKLRDQFTGILVEDVPLDPRKSLYAAWGDWFALSCFLFVVFLIAASGWRRWVVGGKTQAA